MLTEMKARCGEREYPVGKRYDYSTPIHTDQGDIYGSFLLLACFVSPSQGRLINELDLITMTDSAEKETAKAAAASRARGKNLTLDELAESIRRGAAVAYHRRHPNTGGYMLVRVVNITLDPAELKPKA